MDKKEKNDSLASATQHKGEWQKPRLSQLSVDNTQGGFSANTFDTATPGSSYWDALGGGS